MYYNNEGGPLKQTQSYFTVYLRTKAHVKISVAFLHTIHTALP